MFTILEFLNFSKYKYYFYSWRIRQVDEKVVSNSMSILKNNTTISNHKNVINKVKNNYCY